MNWPECNFVVCRINMTVSSRDSQTVLLLPHLMAMKQSTDMTLFTVTQWALEEKDPHRPEDGIMMTVVLKRKISKEIVTTYVPTALLMMITLATIFIKPFYFEAALGTNLTTMLMMTTIFMTVMAELPSTAYVKHIDVWLIGCQLVPFCEVLLLITIEAFREQKDEDGSPATERATATASAPAPASAQTPAPGSAPGSAPAPAPASTGKQTKEECLAVIKCKTAVAAYSLRLLRNAERYLLPFLVGMLCVIYTITSLVFYYQEVHWSTAV